MTLRLDMSIACDLADLAAVKRAVADFAAAHELSDRVAHAMALSVDEIVSNVILHGFPPGQADRRIHCAAQLGDGSVHMAFSDNGPAFNPLADAPAPDMSPSVEDRRIGGLGVHLVKMLADESAYRRDVGWNRLQLSWRRHDSGSEDAPP